MPRKLSPEEVAALELEAPPVPAGRKLSPEEVAQLGLETGPPPRTTKGQAFASALSQVPFGLGDEIGAALQAKAATTGRFDSPQEMRKEWAQTYRQARSENRQIDESASDEHPGIYYPSLIGGSILSTMGGDMTAGPRTLGALVKAGAKAGLKYGAAGGFGGGKADLTKGELLSALLETGLGAAAGGAIGGLAPVVGKGISAAYRGLVKPTEAAKLLRSKGVDLSIGQMSPGNIIAAAEEAGQSSPILGKSLERTREKGREGWQRAVINETHAPGAWRPMPEEPAEALAASYQSYAPAYDAVRGQPVPVDGLRQALTGAADAPGSYATPQDIQAAERFLANQAGLVERELPAITEVAPRPIAGKPRLVPSPVDPETVTAQPWQLPNAQPAQESPLGQLPPALLEKGGVDRTLVPDPTQVRPRVLGPLPKAKAPAPATGTRVTRRPMTEAAAEATEQQPPIQRPLMSGSVDAEAILKARENVRQEISRRMLSGDETGAQLLRNAEAVLTSRLEEGLTGKAADALRATDAQYGRYKVVEDAIRRGGDQPGGFTPAQLSQSVRANTQKGAYARGGGGALRDLAVAGRASLDARIPPTGVRLLNVGGALPAWLANTALGKALLLGETAGQRFLSRAEGKAGEKGLLQALQRLAATRSGVNAAD